MNGRERRTTTQGTKAWSMGMKLAAFTALAGLSAAADLRENFDNGWHFKYFGAANPAELSADARFAPALPGYDESAAPAAPAPARAEATLRRGTTACCCASMGCRTVPLPMPI